MRKLWSSFSRKKTPDLVECADLMLKALVREYCNSPAQWWTAWEAGESIDEFDVAEWAGLLGRGEGQRARNLVLLNFSIVKKGKRPIECHILLGA